MWFFKDYDDRFKANRREVFYNLVLETTEIQDNLVLGKWSYAGLRGGGQWKVSAESRIESDDRLKN